MRYWTILTCVVWSVVASADAPFHGIRPDIITNLQDGYVRIRIDLMVNGQAKDNPYLKILENNQDLLIDTAIGMLHETTRDNLRSRKQRVKFRENFLEKVNLRLKETLGIEPISMVLVSKLNIE